MFIFINRQDTSQGHILLTIGDAQYDAYPGDSWYMLENVTHGAKIPEDSVAIEIFSPVREDYLPNDNRQN
jgi:unsaturated pyranuronate lyase